MFLQMHYVYVHTTHVVFEVWDSYWSSLNTDYLKHLHRHISKLSSLKLMSFKNLFHRTSISKLFKSNKRLLRHGRSALDNGIGFSCL